MEILEKIIFITIVILAAFFILITAFVVIGYAIWMKTGKESGFLDESYQQKIDDEEQLKALRQMQERRE